MQHGDDSPCRVHVHWDGTVVTVVVSGELGDSTAAAVAEDLLKIAVDRPERLELDLNDLVVTDGAGARAFDRTLRALAGGCPVIIRGFRPSTWKVLWGSDFMHSWEARNIDEATSAI